MFLKSRPDEDPDGPGESARATAELVLASTSTYRRELLTRFRLDFRTAAPHVDETRRAGEAPRELAIRLARAKAERVAAERIDAGSPDAWIIGSDQVAVRGEAILGKPGTRARCIEQLQAASGQTVTFLTAVAVVHQADAACHEFIDTTRVAFRNLDTDTITRYVDAEVPLDCAGGFKSEGLGAALCETIESCDPTALIGLPLLRLAAVLRSAGFRIP